MHKFGEPINISIMANPSNNIDLMVNIAADWWIDGKNPNVGDIINEVSDDTDGAKVLAQFIENNAHSLVGMWLDHGTDVLGQLLDHLLAIKRSCADTINKNDTETKVSLISDAGVLIMIKDLNKIMVDGVGADDPHEVSNGIWLNLPLGNRAARYLEFIRSEFELLCNTVNGMYGRMI